MNRSITLAFVLCAASVASAAPFGPATPLTDDTSLQTKQDLAAPSIRSDGTLVLFTDPLLESGVSRNHAPIPFTDRYTISDTQPAAFAVASRANRSLAVWIESDGRVRSAFLGDRGEVLRTLELAPTSGSYTIDITATPFGYTAVWTMNTDLVLATFDASGLLVSVTDHFTLTHPRAVSIASNGTKVLTAFESEDLATFVYDGGRDDRLVAQNAIDPSIASDGQNFALSYEIVSSGVYVQKLAADATSIGTPLRVAETNSGDATVVWDGSAYIVAYLTQITFHGVPVSISFNAVRLTRDLLFFESLTGSGIPNIFGYELDAAGGEVVFTFKAVWLQAAYAEVEQPAPRRRRVF